VTIAPRLGQFGPLPVESLLVGARAEHVADHRRPAGHDVGAGRGDLPGRVGVRAVAEDDIEQDRRDVGAERLLPHDLPAGGRVDHRVRPALGVLLLAEVQADVRPGRRAASPSVRRSGMFEYTGPSAWLRITWAS
jgi:hypothetical protein